MGQLSYEPFNEVATSSVVASIALSLAHFCLGLSAAICRK
jgi:hypothetical protein